MITAGMGIEFDEVPLPAGHALFHRENELPRLPENVVTSVGNCGLYFGPCGIQVKILTWLGSKERSH